MPCTDSAQQAGAREVFLVDQAMAEALLKYDEAERSGLFARFWVVTPTYYHQPQVDPWLVADVTGTRLCAVIAQWDDA